MEPDSLLQFSQIPDGPTSPYALINNNVVLKSIARSPKRDTRQSSPRTGQEGAEKEQR